MHLYHYTPFIRQPNTYPHLSFQIFQTWTSVWNNSNLNFTITNMSTLYFYYYTTQLAVLSYQMWFYHTFSLYFYYTCVLSYPHKHLPHVVSFSLHCFNFIIMHHPFVNPTLLHISFPNIKNIKADLKYLYPKLYNNKYIYIILLLLYH